jgi:hypothetical protein
LALRLTLFFAFGIWDDCSFTPFWGLQKRWTPLGLFHPPPLLHLNMKVSGFCLQPDLDCLVARRKKSLPMLHQRQGGQPKGGTPQQLLSEGSCLGYAHSV